MTITILTFDGSAVYYGDVLRGYLYPNGATWGHVGRLIGGDNDTAIVMESVDPQLMFGLDEERGDESSKVPFPTLTEQRAFIAAQRAKLDAQTAALTPALFEAAARVDGVGIRVITQGPGGPYVAMTVPRREGGPSVCSWDPHPTIPAALADLAEQIAEHAPQPGPR